MNKILITIDSTHDGQECQDCTRILFNAYISWAKNNNFITNILNRVQNDADGIKNAVIEIIGDNIDDRIKNETGIHRFVRISPFDSQHRRHSTFVKVTINGDKSVATGFLRSYIFDPYVLIKNHISNNIEITDRNVISEIFNGKLEHLF